MGREVLTGMLIVMGDNIERLDGGDDRFCRGAVMRQYLSVCCHHFFVALFCLFIYIHTYMHCTHVLCRPRMQNKNRYDLFGIEKEKNEKKKKSV